MSTQAQTEASEHTMIQVAKNWDRYTSADHEVWQILYAKRMRELEYRRLIARTGWSAVPVAGFLPAKEFFASPGRRRFPTTVTIRSRDSIDYVPEPDIFHDVFGHVPLAGFSTR